MPGSRASFLIFDLFIKHLLGSRITTGGTNAGVMKHVGEAIKKFSIDPNNRIVLLGIANWCTIADNHLLIKKNV